MKKFRIIYFMSISLKMLLINTLLFTLIKNYTKLPIFII